MGEQPLTRRQYSFADERVQLKPCVFQFRHNASVLMIRVVLQIKVPNPHQFGDFVQRGRQPFVDGFPAAGAGFDFLQQGDECGVFGSVEGQVLADIVNKAVVLQAVDEVVHIYFH